MVACIDRSPRSLDNKEMTSEAWQHESLHAMAEIKPLCNRLASGLTRAGFTGREIFAVRLALEEAVVNAIKHGNRCDPIKAVHVSYRVNTEDVLLNVEDEGMGFDPGDVADPLSPENMDRSTGRGLLLMRHYMTWVKYNDRGNAVTLYKRRNG